MTQQSRDATPKSSKSQKKERIASAISHTSGAASTTKASAAVIDVEVFGGVITNIEKLLTLKQKNKLRRNVKMRERSRLSLTELRNTSQSRPPRC